MSWLDSLKELNDLDLADLDFENVGSWPMAAKAMVIVLLFVALLAGGYYYHLAALSGREGRQPNPRLQR
jgi:type IV pilus assembly protein PilO